MDMPGFFAIIPANLRYDKRLPANAKLLYAEITALCSAKGYCWAYNSYFAKLYGVDERTVRRWLEKLKEYDYIVVNREENHDGKVMRKIYLKEYYQEPEEELEEELEDELEEKPKKEASKGSSQGRTKMSGGADKNVRVGADKNVRQNNKYINNKKNIYSARARVTQKQKNNKRNFNNFPQRNYDFSLLEEALLNKNRPKENGSG